MSNDWPGNGPTRPSTLGARPQNLQRRPRRRSRRTAPFCRLGPARPAIRARPRSRLRARQPTRPCRAPPRHPKWEYHPGGHAARTLHAAQHRHQLAVEHAACEDLSFFNDRAADRQRRASTETLERATTAWQEAVEPIPGRLHHYSRHIDREIAGLEHHQEKRRQWLNDLKPHVCAGGQMPPGHTLGRAGRGPRRRSTACRRQ